ncbi:helix-turn-helix domain-containing protein [Streptomyces sp. NPDC048606]|uniref:PucR family transcriptional regulator n=1 Tax=Streptomyces sp. NPDC048606 TaxID=3154726 RepID=UPI00343835BD
MPDHPATLHATDRRIGLLATALNGRLTDLSERAADRILAPSGAAAYRRLVPVDELRGSCRAHLTFALRALAGLYSPAPATATARRRAGQGVPLPALIAAYHAGGRLLLEELTDEARGAGPDALAALPDGAARLLALIETGAHEITAAYRNATTAADEPDGPRAPALTELLDGTARTTEALWRAADTLRLPYDGPFVVLVADPPAGPAPELGNRLAAHGIASAWSRTAGLLAGLVAVRDRSTPDRMSDVLQRSAALRFGASPVFTSLADCATGLRLARLALATADPAGPPVATFDDGPLAGLVAHSPDVAARMARSVLGTLLDLPDGQRTVLIGTLTAWYAASGSTEGAARALHCHGNTVRQRLRRIGELTGRTVADPVGAAELYAALQAVRALPYSVLR